MRTRVLPFVMTACVLACLSACSTLPDYHRPSVAVPAHFVGAGTDVGADAASSSSSSSSSSTSASANWTVATPADDHARGPWWTVFHDDALNQLESRIDISNQTVKKAVAQLEQARSLADYQHAGFFPTVTASASTVPYRTSANLLGKSLAGRAVPDHNVGLSVSWEPDLFGRIKDATLNAQDSADASAADLEAVRLAAGSDLAVDYFNYRSLEQQSQLLQRSVKAYTAAYDILQQQLQNGAIDASAVAQAQTQLESAQTQATDIEAQRRVILHAMATLVGEPASTFSVPPSTAIVASVALAASTASDASNASNASRMQVPVIPVTLPSQLLERRPDIAAAERRVAAANAQIGLARAAYFPSLQLGGSAGLESTFLSPWLSAPSLFWSVGPQLVGTLFDGGRHKAMLNDAKGQYDAAVADYRQTVLVSFQQVEDALSDLDSLASEQQSQDRATQAASLALTLTKNRFDAGAVSYLDVVTAQAIALQNDQLDEQLSARRMASSVLLIKALGGGWRASTLR